MEKHISKGRILVTGGAGYIGSHAVVALCDAGYSVTVLDNLSAGAREAVDSRAELVELDLSDAAGLAQLFGGASGLAQKPKFDAVMHFAGSIEVGLSMKEPARFFENNVVNGVKLLEAMRAGGVTRIIFSSTAAVYGNPVNALIAESDPLEPTNFYGLSKLQFEGILAGYARLHGFRSVALRYFNAAGLGRVSAESGAVLAERHNPETHLIPLLLRAARADFAVQKSGGNAANVHDAKPIFQVYGDDYPTPDGTCIRDFIHVTDLVDAHVKALEYLFQGGESVALNLGNGKGYSVKEVMEAARAAWGVEIPFEVAPRRDGDPAVLVADARRACELLGWQPKYGLLEILKSIGENF